MYYRRTYPFPVDTKDCLQIRSRNQDEHETFHKLYMYLWHIEFSKLMFLLFVQASKQATARAMWMLHNNVMRWEWTREHTYILACRLWVQSLFCLPLLLLVTVDVALSFRSRSFSTCDWIARCRAKESRVGQGQATNERTNKNSVLKVFRSVMFSITWS